MIKFSKENRNIVNNKYSDTSKIEKMIDEIILNNKEKLDKIYEKELELNFDRFSIKNKYGDTIFYIKKNSKKKTEDKITKLRGEK